MDSPTSVSPKENSPSDEKSSQRNYRLERFAELIRKGGLPSTIPEQISIPRRLFDSHKSSHSFSGFTLGNGLNISPTDMNKSVSTSGFSESSNNLKPEFQNITISSPSKEMRHIYEYHQQQVLPKSPITAPSSGITKVPNSARPWLLGRRRSTGGLKNDYSSSKHIPTHSTTFPLEVHTKANKFTKNNNIGNKSEESNGLVGKDNHGIQTEIAIAKSPTVINHIKKDDENHETYNATEKITPKVLTSTIVEEKYRGLPKNPILNSPQHRRSTDETQFGCVGPYRILRTVGAGSFSQVKQAVDTRTDENVALKMISKSILDASERMQLSVSREIDLMQSINHPHIIKLFDTVESREHMVLVMEYVEGGELFDLISERHDQLTTSNAKRLFRELASAVKYLHDNLICHRDLKIENVLLDAQLHIKLCDFGLARRFEEAELLTTRCGSEEYVAPEVIKALPYDPIKTDIWALGVILFAMLTSELPFILEPGQRPRQLFHKIARADYKFPDERRKSESIISERAAMNGTECEKPKDAERPTGPIVSDSAKSLVRMILQSNPQRRATINEILNHEWLTSNIGE